jgi:hypothetical protein
MTLQRINKKKNITKISTYWWLKEVEEQSGKDGLILTYDDSLLDFDFKNEWDIFEIKTNGEQTGVVAILPTELFPTIVLFSSKETWTINWLKSLLVVTLGYLKNQNEMQNKESNNTKQQYNSTLTQIFLTHQHKDSLQKENQEKLFYHDITEDRQILYKKLNLNN